MKISGAEAIDILRKWGSDRAVIKGFFLAAPEGSALVKFAGLISVSDNVVSVISESVFEMSLDMSIAHFQYTDWREAPDHLKEWAKSSFESALTIHAGRWRCDSLKAKANRRRHPS